MTLRRAIAVLGSCGCSEWAALAVFAFGLFLLAIVLVITP